MMLSKCCTQYVSKFGKLSSGLRTEKGQFSFPYQRKAMPKNVQTTTQLHSINKLTKYCSKFSKIAPEGNGSKETHNTSLYWQMRASQVVQVVNNLPANAGDAGLIPGSGRSLGRGNDNSLHIPAWKIHG